MYSGSRAPHVSRTECIPSCGLPTSTVRIPIPAAVIGPIVRLLSLPFVVLTLGLFLLVVNAALLGLTALFTDRLEVDGFVAAVVGGLLLGAGRMWARRACRALLRRRLPGRLGVRRQIETRLATAAQLEIDLGQELAVEQRAMQGARRVVDLEAATQRIEADLCAGKPPARQGHGVGRALGRTAR